QNFWNNVVAWMTNEPETQRIKIETDKEKYGENEKVLIKIKMVREDYQPLPREKVDLVVTSVSKNKVMLSQILKTNERGETEMEFVPQGEGYYSIKLSGASPTLKVNTYFSVFSETAEFDKPLINSLLLQKMAEATGGIYRILSRQTDLSGQKFLNPEIRMKSDSRVFSLWDNWWGYLLIVGFLFVEWWMRRKSGLS
ncbi:MAG: hypothetical protein VYC17_01940, partial [Nitrospinota bacterium]|nr:hypothetical protein [Nitrospinota bacterium]